ncbi:MAG: 30S ribosomal protein S20 [Acidobacteriota bacterium]|nr:30S ribosomal protein S20 [Acidobacteriota bacterium]
MPRKKTVLKRNRQNAIHRDRNRGYRTRMRSTIRDLRALVESGDGEGARQALPATLGVIDVTARKGVIHDNTAARYKSRLTKLVSAATAPAPAE